MPDEGAPPTAQKVLLVVWAAVIAVAGAALSTGAITGRTRPIIAGCLLFIADFVLLYVWYSNVLVPSERLSIAPETPGNPPEIVPAAWVIWIAFPVVTTLLVVARDRAARGPSIPRSA